MRWHDLKTDPAAFDAVADGNKTHEIRLDDRGFKIGDGLLLRRTRDTGWAMKNTGAPLEFTGQEYRAVVTHILDGYGLAPGWVVLSIKPCCPFCGTHEVSQQQTCHNSACAAYARDVTVYEGWNVQKSSPLAATPSDDGEMPRKLGASTDGVPTPPPAPQAKSRCASECELICQQPDGHGGCAKRSTPEQAVQGALTKAAQDVLAERQRQIDKEGWTPAHDDAHGGGEMASAAAVYALRASGHFESGVPTYWPWDFADYKPKDNRSNLIRAGALVLAEIERLDRMEVKNG